MQQVFLAMLQQRAADAVHDALRDNGTRTNPGAAPARPKSRKCTAFGRPAMPGASLTYGITTTRSTDGSFSSTPRTGASESMVLPL